LESAAHAVANPVPDDGAQDQAGMAPLLRKGSSVSKTQKETIEYDAKFLAEWNAFCDSKGYVKRQASHACRIAFMKLLSAEQREQMMYQAMQHVNRAKDTRKG
jgi:hypothetical protein